MVNTIQVSFNEFVVHVDGDDLDFKHIPKVLKIIANVCILDGLQGATRALEAEGYHARFYRMPVMKWEKVKDE